MGEGATFLVDLGTFDEGYCAGKRLGAEGRGSRARYRRTVWRAAEQWRYLSQRYDHEATHGRARLAGLSWERLAGSYDRAARRARTILHRLDTATAGRGRATLSTEEP